MLRTTINSSLRRQLLTNSYGIRSISSSVSRKQETANQTTPSNSETLSWSDFFKLRKQKRTINFASSATTALLASSLSWNYMANIEFDPTQMIMGFDPVFVFAGCFFTCGGLGFLLGPALGNFIFRLANSKKINDFKIKDKELLAKIVRNRVDPSSQSFSNPVPDYYGEKIQSLKNYRDWLRDGNAYRRKAKEFL